MTRTPGGWGLCLIALLDVPEDMSYQVVFRSRTHSVIDFRAGDSSRLVAGRIIIQRVGRREDRNKSIWKADETWFTWCFQDYWLFVFLLSFKIKE